MHVYVIVNRETLKIYVGKTLSSNLNQYLRRKIRDALRGTYEGRSHLFAAMQKYPSSVWSIHPLISGLDTNEDLCYWEKLFIKLLGTHHPEVGYNISYGGEGNPGRRTLESRVKMTRVNKRIWSNSDLRARQSRTIKQLRLDPVYCAKMKEAANLAKLKPEVHNKFVESAKKMWDRGDYRTHRAEADKIKWGNLEKRAGIIDKISRAGKISWEDSDRAGSKWMNLNRKSRRVCSKDQPKFLEMGWKFGRPPKV